MTPAPVSIYVTGWCPYCQRAKSLLASKSIAFDEVDIEANTEARQEMMARSGRRTVPQIFIHGKHVGGCDDLFALEGNGELDRLLQGA